VLTYTTGIMMLIITFTLKVIYATAIAKLIENAVAVGVLFALVAVLRSR
jgi:hypothetical protein